MKKTLYILFFLFSFANVFSQEKAKEEIYTVVEYMPDFADGGIKGFHKYVAENINYSNLSNKDVEGKVFAKFIVCPDGSIENVQVLRGIAGCDDCSAEAIRILKTMPKWILGKQNGKTVSVYYSVPVKFNVK